MEKHFTASVYILEKGQALFIFHPKFQKWLPPGGHVEPNESPADAARREVGEETGLTIEWLRDERAWIETDNARSFERPFACLAEDVPAGDTTVSHQHLDFIYVAQPLGTLPCHHTHKAKWFPFEAILSPSSTLATFPDTKEMLRAILASPLAMHIEGPPSPLSL